MINRHHNENKKKKIIRFFSHDKFSGYLLFLNRARVLVFMVAAYCVYSVYARVGWIGTLLSANLAFLSNDLLVGFLRGYERAREASQDEETRRPEPPADDFPEDCEFSPSAGQPEDVDPVKPCRASASESAVKMEKSCSPSKAVKSDLGSLEEMRRIMGSLNHYETLGFPRSRAIDLAVLKKEYRRKVRSLLILGFPRGGASSLALGLLPLRAPFDYTGCARPPR